MSTTWHARWKRGTCRFACRCNTYGVSLDLVLVLPRRRLAATAAPIARELEHETTIDKATHRTTSRRVLGIRHVDEDPLAQNEHACATMLEVGEQTSLQGSETSAHCSTPKVVTPDLLPTTSPVQNGTL